MHVRRFSLLMVSFFTMIAPAHAKDGQMVNTAGLPPVTFHKSPPQLQILDDSPRVSDCRRPAEKSPPIVVNVPALPESGGAVAVPAGAVPVGNNIYVVPGAPAGVRNSNPMLGDYSYLQPAGMRSHIPARPVVNGPALAPGFTTGVHGEMHKAPNAVAAPQRPINFSKPMQNMAGEPVPMMYRDPNVSVGGSGSRSSIVRTSTGAKLLEKMH